MLTSVDASLSFLGIRSTCLSALPDAFEERLTKNSDRAGDMDIEGQWCGARWTYGPVSTCHPPHVGAAFGAAGGTFGLPGFL